MSYLMIFIAAIFVNNIVLSQFLGICPFLGVSKNRYRCGNGGGCHVRHDPGHNCYLSGLSPVAHSLSVGIYDYGSLHLNYRFACANG